jgi:hypothetical protein
MSYPTDQAATYTRLATVAHILLGTFRSEYTVVMRDRCPKSAILLDYVSIIASTDKAYGEYKTAEQYLGASVVLRRIHRHCAIYLDPRSEHCEQNLRHSLDTPGKRSSYNRNEITRSFHRFQTKHQISTELINHSCRG